jgi:hypothetical protein
MQWEPLSGRGCVPLLRREGPCSDEHLPIASSPCQVCSEHRRRITFDIESTSSLIQRPSCWVVHSLLVSSEKASRRLTTGPVLTPAQWHRHSFVFSTMASFFQPPSTGDPTVEACKHTSFQVYCNSLLTNGERWEQWYQLVLLGIAAGGIGLPLLIWLSKFLVRSIHSLWKRRSG